MEHLEHLACSSVHILLLQEALRALHIAGKRTSYNTITSNNDQTTFMWNCKEGSGFTPNNTNKHLKFMARFDYNYYLFLAQKVSPKAQSTIHSLQHKTNNKQMSRPKVFPLNKQKQELQQFTLHFVTWNLYLECLPWIKLTERDY